MKLSGIQTPRNRRLLYGIACVALFVCLAAQLLLSIRHLSMTMDEGAHLYAGYEHWRARDFGVNPEHPPLVKLVAAMPLLGLRLQQPHPPNPFFMAEEYMGGAELLQINDGNRLLLRGRTAVTIFTLTLAVLVLAAGYEMFGPAAGLLALFLFAFEPTVLAHGALVTTDMGVATFVFGAVYALYRYVKRPGIGRLAVFAVALGLAMVAKLSGVIVLPILVVCVAVEFLTHREGRRAGSMAGELAIAVIVSYGILWGFYGFQYAARPDGLFMVPPLPVFAMQLPSGAERWVVLHLARWHLLPEAYLYGWTKLPIDQIGHPAFLFGHVYPRGVWYYFPAAVLVKTSLTMLLLVFSVPLLFLRQLRSFQRELSFLVLPVVVILGAAMTSHLDIGVRHVLPLYPFFAVLGGAAAWALAEASRVGRYAVAALLLFQIISSLHAFPNYLPYGNEAFGGSGRTYRALADSNVDWGQQMQQVQGYLRVHPARECWFATPQFFPSPVIPGTPCKALPSGFSFWAGLPIMTIPEHIDGVVLVGATDASGALWGGDGMNPYQQFEDGRPEAKIANAVLVYRGSFDVPLAAAQAHYSHVAWLLREGKAEHALAEAQTAASLVPWSAQVHAELGQTLLRVHREGEANEAFAKAMQMAKAKSPQDQSQMAELIEGLRHPRF
jgi:hypothetical protein